MYQIFLKEGRYYTITEYDTAISACEDRLRKAQSSEKIPQKGHKSVDLSRVIFM